MNAHRARPGATARKRVATLIVLVAALLVGSSLPSWAAFSDSAAAGASITTVTVAPPAGVTAVVTKCTGRSVDVTLSWTASTTARVSGYRIRAYFGEAWQDQTTVGRTQTSWSAGVDPFYVNNYTLTFTVWTLTDYGWTAESPRTARVVC